MLLKINFALRTYRKIDFISFFQRDFISVNCWQWIYVRFDCRLLGTSPWYRPVTIAAILISWFTYHVYYLAFIHFDYGYNMQMNIYVGEYNSLNSHVRLPYVGEYKLTSQCINSHVRLPYVGEYKLMSQCINSHVRLPYVGEYEPMSQ